jgi:hypothetical protein
LTEPEFADERYEADISDGAGPDPIRPTFDQGQDLRCAIAQRNNHAAAARQLID